MEEVNKTIKLRNATLIGNFDYIFAEVLPEITDCYIISKDSIKDIESRLLGQKIITTKPNY
jgi:hypothetical protein